MRANSPKFSEIFLALSEDPRFRLDAYEASYLEEGNPVYCWKAVKFCTDRNLPFPDWVSLYLWAVANNMLSDEARRSSDLRKILPRLLLFPKRKPGPGGALGPDVASDDRMLFAIKFISKLEQDHEIKPTLAFEKARHEMETSVSDKDDKTLWRWLAEELGLTKSPQTNAEWRAAGRAHYFPSYAGINHAYRKYVIDKPNPKMLIRPRLSKTLPGKIGELRQANREYIARQTKNMVAGRPESSKASHKKIDEGNK